MSTHIDPAQINIWRGCKFLQQRNEQVLFAL